MSIIVVARFLVLKRALAAITKLLVIYRCLLTILGYDKQFKLASCVYPQFHDVDIDYQPWLSICWGWCCLTKTILGAHRHTNAWWRLTLGNFLKVNGWQNSRIKVPFSNCLPHCSAGSRRIWKSKRNGRFWAGELWAVQFPPARHCARLAENFSQSKASSIRSQRTTFQSGNRRWRILVPILGGCQGELFCFRHISTAIHSADFVHEWWSQKKRSFQMLISNAEVGFDSR